MNLPEVLRRVLSCAKPEDEEATIEQIILPILKCLGWGTIESSEIAREHRIDGEKGGRVDIALKVADLAYALVEAKRVGANLDRYEDQIMRYAFYEAAGICVLTNGFEWRLYYTWEPRKWRERRFAVLNLVEYSIDDLTSDFSRYLSVDALTSGDSEDEAVLAIEGLNEDRNILHNAVSEVAAPRQSNAKPTGMTLFEQKYVFENAGWRNVLRGVADILYDEHGYKFSRTLDLKDGNYPLVSKFPEQLYRPPGKPVNRAANYEINSSEHYIYLGGGKQEVMQKCHKLLKCFGHVDSDLEVLFD